MSDILVAEGIAENFRFMVLEVTKQVENAWKLLDTRNPKLVESISSRDDYIDVLKSVIENKCFSAINRVGAADRRVVNQLRAMTTLASNLERIADFAENVVAQTEYLKDFDFLKRYDYGKFFSEILQALGLCHDAFIKRDMGLAFRICRSEFSLDYLYKVQFDRILNELRSGAETENLITSHLILRYLERMGDALLNVGEAIIFAVVGEKFKIKQYEALKENLAKSGIETPISDLEFQSIWGSRSGCRIGRVQAPPDPAKVSGGVLFKEGAKRKILQEKENIERWEAIMPGLPPRILSVQQEDSQASMLVEFLDGCTYQEVVLNAEMSVVQNATFVLEQTLLYVWEHTKSFGPGQADFLTQLKSRLPDVYRLHPFLKETPKTVGGVQAPSLELLLARLEPDATKLISPFTVFIHGDFNINNIVYDHAAQSIRFIDLHRSKLSDYLQDVSVFLVSNFRLPIFEEPLRERLNWSARNMYAFAKRYAEQSKDATFQARLCLGLARSYITSARFELNKRFVKDMFLRGVYLLDRMAAHKGKPWEEFTLPEDSILF